MTKVIGRKVSMNAMIKQAVDHWHYVAPLLSKPENEDDFHTLVEALDELLDTVGDDESHPLMGLILQLGDLVSDYESEHLPMPKGDGRAALAFLMEQHGLGQSDLAEVATQSVISEILSVNAYDPNVFDQIGKCTWKSLPSIDRGSRTLRSICSRYACPYAKRGNDLISIYS